VAPADGSDKPQEATAGAPSDAPKSTVKRVARKAAAPAPADGKGE
jgi:small subunit ribosomal protein S3